MPRALVVTPQPFYEDRGTPIALRYVIRALCERGYEVDLLAFPLGRDVLLPGLRILRIGNPLGIAGVPVGFSLRKASLDVVLRIALARQLRSTPYACVHAVEEAAYLALGPCRRLGLPLIYDMASSIPAQLSKGLPFSIPPAPSLLRVLERRVLRGADLVLCSAGLEPHVRQVAPGQRVEAWRYPSLPPTVDGERARMLRDELALAPRCEVLLYAGTFAPYQGVEALVDAMPEIVARRPGTSLVLVGATAEEAESLGRRVAREDRHALRIVLRRPRAELDAWYGLATLLVSPRARGANAPLKMFDYLGTGLPILASRGPAHASFASRPGVTLFDHTPAGFAAAAVTALTRSAEAGAPATPAPHGSEWIAFADRVERAYARVLRRV